MTNRRTAVKVNTETPETDITPIVDNADIAPVVDTAAVEAPKTDKAPITLEALIAAHTAAKAAFVELPDKGDIVGFLDAAGDLLSVGSVATKPDTGAQIVQIVWATDGRTTTIFRKNMIKIGPNGWTVQN